jgi:hypothetical protein
MRVGQDRDGREITFNETSNTFSLAGIQTTIDKLMAYDRGGHVEWASSDIQEWAQKWESERQSFVQYQQAQAASAAAQEAARHAAVAKQRSLKARGYDPEAALHVAAAFHGLATTFLVLATSAGVSYGLGVAVILLVQSVRFAFFGLLALVLLGATGWLVGYFGSLFLRVIGSGLATLVQVEMNTRPAE